MNFLESNKIKECKNCKDRYPACHDYCEHFKKRKEKDLEIRKKKEEEKEYYFYKKQKYKDYDSGKKKADKVNNMMV